MIDTVVKAIMDTMDTVVIKAIIGITEIGVTWT
jgi:hypothetical protein